MGNSFWMVVSSYDNFQATKGLGFTLQGFKRRYKKRVSSMQPGDRLLYYVAGLRRFAATATLTSAFFEEHAVIWHADQGDDFPYRVRMKPDVVLPEEAFLDARELAPRLLYVKKWPPESWTLAFQGMLHQVPQADLRLVEDEMKKVLR